MLKKKAKNKVGLSKWILDKWWHAKEAHSTNKAKK